MACLTLALPAQGWFPALAAIIVFGIPHGALDGEVARAVLRPRFGRAWFGVFAIPYLGLAALVLAGWRMAPLPTLAAFLAVSVWHFGSEDAGPGRPWAALVRGGLPIAVPVLVHPAATALVFGTVAAVRMAQPPGWLVSAALAWLAIALAWAVRHPRESAVPGLLAGMFVLLPPLPAFAIYFVCVHAPAHTAWLIGHARRAPRVCDMASAVRLALPITLLTIGIGAALWPLYTGSGMARLLAVTVQGLAALTLPHVALDLWLTRRERESALAPGLAGMGQETIPSF